MDHALLTLIFSYLLYTLRHNAFTGHIGRNGNIQSQGKGGEHREVERSGRVHPPIF